MKSKIELIIDNAFKRVNKIKTKNKSTKELRNVSLAKLQSFSDYTTSYLDKILKELPIYDKAHDFHKSLINIYMTEKEFKECIKNIYFSRKKIEEFKKKYYLKIKYCFDRNKIIELRKEFYGRAVSLLKDVEECYEKLLNLNKELKKLSSLDPELPTIIVAGCANAGKSTFISNVSTRSPEIANYPFTTKNIHIGHIVVNEHKKIQIVDTPGLLEKRKLNKIEQKTLVSIFHLTGVVLYFFDVTNFRVLDIDKQIELYKKYIEDLDKSKYIIFSKKDLIDDENNIKNVLNSIKNYKNYYVLETKDENKCKEVIMDIINKEKI